jgi:transcription-repair coupling factor (superfamily II helicase)
MENIRLEKSLWNFFPKIHSFPASKKRRLFSVFGLPNHSAKAFFLSHFLQERKIKKAILLFQRKNEMVEYKKNFECFLNTEEWSFFLFPFTEDKEIKEREKAEFLFSLSFSPQKTLFFLTVDEAKELFPSVKKWKEEKISLLKKEKISLSYFFEKLSDIGYTPSFDKLLQKGEFFRSGDVIDLFPVGFSEPVRIDIEFEKIEKISLRESEKEITSLDIYPLTSSYNDEFLPHFLQEDDLLILDDYEDLSDEDQSFFKKTQARKFEISSFPQSEEESLHLRYVSVLKFYTLEDFLRDVREKTRNEWKTVIFTKRFKEVQELFQEEKIPFSSNFLENNSFVVLFDASETELIPPSFQNPIDKIAFFTDREIFHIKKTHISAKTPEMLDFLTSLKTGDFIVHLDHGIGKFLGIVEQKFSEITREYLEIEYLANDKLFVPIEHADKVSRYITDEDRVPKLMRLGSVEWKNVQKRAKKETEKIAKELLRIYAKRAKAKGLECDPDTDMQREFEESFPYEETPGQLVAIRDIKKDLESGVPMDRLLCGDVGFGKTEIAMRAAFKVVQKGSQVAVIAPITILADQHYQNFQSRMKRFGVRIEMLSRFRSITEQKKILKDLANGKIDIIIGTHRLLSEDVKFYNLGILIIDEEQRFGVKQKEKLKAMRKEIHILTMTATPIPRTMNLALHKLREISTITTPPPGRLPILTEVRKYSDRLIRDAILKELERGGQVYFLHNRVETIESITHKLRLLVPEATFLVAHGQLRSDELEKRIYQFKKNEANVLVSSTIIENGIDLPNANTMIINKAETFGLSQLYQLRGRIGRSNRQAYAYLLYHSQKLPQDAKKRLRAIVEASELGSGFQLSMRDLEIRGAGDVLGVSQHGSMNVVGVSHFLRLLKNTIAEIERGEILEEQEEASQDVLLEIPIDAYIPSVFIADQKEKILAYQKLASVSTLENLREVSDTLEEEYGKPPEQLKNLIKILELKILAKRGNIRAIRITSDFIELHLTKKVTAHEIMNLLKDQPKWMITGEMIKMQRVIFGENWFVFLVDALRLLIPKKNNAIAQEHPKFILKKKK